MKTKLFLILLFIMIWGCSAHKAEKIPESISKLKNLTIYPADVRPEETISFKKDAVYGSTKKVLIGRMGDLAVDSSGRVFIADLGKLTIDVFEPGGRFLTHLGRKGEGPGEFGAISRLQISRDHLYISNGSFKLKESIFTLHPLGVDNTILLAENRHQYQELNGALPWIENLYVKNNNTYVAEFISNPNSHEFKQWQNVEYQGLFYLLDQAGNISSKKLFDINETRTVFGLVVNIKVFFGRPMTVLSSNNNIYLADEPDFFLIKTYSPNGTYRHAFYYPHRKIPLTKKSASEGGISEALIKHNLLLSKMKFMKLPRTWPVLMHMKIDNQNRLWIATVVQNMKDYQWWVLKPNGKLIARFNWPRSKPIKVVKNGYMYTQETDTATGISKIVRYEITMKNAR